MNLITEDKFIRITDIEHFHWKVADAHVGSSISLEDKPLSLAAAVELTLIEADHCKESKTRDLDIFSSCPIYSTVKSANWPTETETNVIRRDHVTVIILPSADNESWWTNELKIIRQKLLEQEFPPKLATGLTGGLAEMVDNAWLHRQNDGPPLLAYLVRNKQFAFSVADIGVGILASLKQNRRYNWLNSSMDAIKFAIQPNVSRFGNGGRGVGNDGMGFTRLLKGMADLRGNARIRSGEAAVLVDGTEEVRSNNLTYLPKLPGLHVSVRCSLRPPRK